MEAIGVRELRQRASEYLRRVEAGETVEITRRGPVIAVLAPPPGQGVGREQLIASGQLLPGRGRLDAVEPLPAVSGRSASDVLAELRSMAR